MKKKLISILLVLCTMFTLLPSSAIPAFAAEDEVTRAQWISQLVAAFAMTVEDDNNMPDNYFADITEDDEFYRDILLAVEFGVIDLEAGGEFKPNDSASREFASQTLNHCLQFKIDENAEYTFSESAEVTYPNDIQVAINRGWFELSGTDFLPNKAITSSEAEKMLADAKTVIESEAVNENYDNKFEFAEGVVVVPETADVKINTDGTVTLTNSEVQIKEGDIFTVFSNGIPIAYKALSVQTQTVDEVAVISITVTKEGTDGAIVSVDYECVSEFDLENFVAEETASYSITNTSTGEAEQMEVQLFGIDYDKKTKTLKASHDIKVGGGLAGSISVEIKNIKLHHKESVSKGEYTAYITGDTTVTESISFDFGEYVGIPKSILLGIVPLEGLGDISLTLDISLKGGMTCTEIGKVKSGFAYKRYDGFRLIASYAKEEFSYVAEVDLKVGLTLALNIDLIVVKGRAWATVGVHGYYKKHRYDEGMPIMCETISAYLYANYGAKVTITGVDEGIFDEKVDIYTEENSPARVYYHYEQGGLVDACTRDKENTDAPIKYSTHTNSAYFNVSPNRAQSSYNITNASGEITSNVVWEYEVDNDGNATITKYKGSASAVAIPSKLDGYTVTKISYNAFRDNTMLRSVTMPDSIIEIDVYAFENCTSLSDVVLSKSLEKLGGDAFRKCTSLMHIEIPKSLDVESNNFGFFRESGLKYVTFEEGITQIPMHLFYGCTEIETISIPDTVTVIQGGAFENCTSLSSILIPDSVVEIRWGAFENCTSLSDVVLSKSLEKLGEDAFRKCTSLTHIEIPKSLNIESNNYGFFRESGLKYVTFEEGITQIPFHLFYACTEIETISIPDTVTVIQGGAFENCTSLSSILIPDSVVEIRWSAFENCTSLSNILIPNSVIYIGEDAFENCTSLSDVVLSKSLEKLGGDAFRKCTSLTHIEIPKSLNIESNNYGFFRESGLKYVTFEEGITQIPMHLFYGCTEIETISIPNTVSIIQHGSFENCTNLSEIVIPDSVTKIRWSAFENCSSLSNIEIPNSVLDIEERAFMNCSNLKKAQLPDTLKNITSKTFYNCKNLIDVELPSTLKGIKDSAFYGCESLAKLDMPEGLITIENDAFNGCKALENIIIPQNVTYVGSNSFNNCDALTTATVNATGSIGQKAFYDCDALTTLTLGDGVTSIGSNMCYGCDKLTDVKLGKYIATIPDSAFRQCQSLETITLPRYCTTVAANAFAENTKLKSAYIPPSVTSIQNNSFSYPAKMAIYGKSGSYAEEYAASRNIAFNAVDAPISSMSYAEKAIGIGRRENVRPALNIEPTFDTSVVTFSSSDENIITVSDTGEIYGKNYGTATVTASSDSGKTASIEVTVLKTASSLKLDKTEMSIGASETASLIVTMNPSDAVDALTWTSSNPAVAEVDQNGNVKAIAKGTAVITVKASYSGVSASCTVNVTVPAEITLTRERVSVNTSNGVLIVAGFDENGKMIKFELVGGSGKELGDFAECHSIKAFLWSSVKDMKPLANSKTV